MKTLPLSKSGRAIFRIAVVVTAACSLTAEADRRPTKAERAAEAAQQAELDALDAERARKAGELAKKEEAEHNRISPDAEATVTDAISKAYHEAIVQYDQRAFSASQKRFLDCCSYCQLAIGRVADPTKLQAIQKECEKYLSRLREIERQSSQAGGIEQKLETTIAPRFYVSDAELGAVLELVRKKTGELGKCPPPNFTLIVSPEAMKRKVSLDVTGVPMLAVLKLALRMTGLDVRFERYSAVITELPRVDGSISVDMTPEASAPPLLPADDTNEAREALSRRIRR